MLHGRYLSIPYGCRYECGSGLGRCNGKSPSVNVRAFADGDFCMCVWCLYFFTREAIHRMQTAPTTEVPMSATMPPSQEMLSCVKSQRPAMPPMRPRKRTLRWISSGKNAAGRSSRRNSARSVKTSSQKKKSRSSRNLRALSKPLACSR